MTETPEKWTIEILLEQEPHRTRAHAYLRTSDDHSFVGVGLAHRSPPEGHLPQVGGYLAVTRALSDLTEELLEAVAADIDADTAAAIGRMTARSMLTSPGQVNGTTHSS